MAPLKVPRKTPQVGLQPLPAVRQISPAGPSDFGGLESEVAGRVGGQVERLGRTALAVDERDQRIAAAGVAADLKRKAQLKDRHDKLRASDAIVKFKDNLRNQAQVFDNRRGIDAFGVTEEANEHIDKLKKEMKGKMENDEIRALFDASTVAPREIFLNQRLTHEASEFNKAEDDNINAKIDTSILEASDAVGGRNEALAIDSAMLDLESAIEQKTDKAGMTGAAAKNVRDGKVSTFHLEVLNRKVAIDAVGAKEYYNDHKKEIAPDKRDNTEIVIENSLIEEESKEIANTIFIQESDSIKQTEAAFDLPERNKHEESVKKEVKKKIKVKQDEINKLIAEKRNDVLDNTTESIKIANSLTEANEAISTLEANRHDLGITTVQINGLQGYANSRFKAKKEKIVTDPVVKERIDRGVTTGEITTTNQYIREAGGNLSQKDLEAAPDFVAKGGRIGDIQEGKLRSKFTEIMFIAPKDDPFLYKLTRDYVVEQVQISGLAPTDTNIDMWMNEALIAGLETESLGKLFRFDQDITLIEALRRGVPFTTAITEDEKKGIVDGILEENATRIPTQRILINDDVVERIFLRQEGLTEEQINEVMTLGVK